MKALTVKQPWASAIASGAKRVENRTWRTNHRGRLAIHAGRGVDRDGRDILASVGVRLPAELPAGAIVAVVDVLGCVDRSYHARHLSLFATIADDPLACGPVCWILENAVALVRPVRCDGALGLWDVPVDVAAEVEACLAAGGGV